MITCVLISFDLNSLTNFAAIATVHNISNTGSPRPFLIAYAALQRGPTSTMCPSTTRSGYRRPRSVAFPGVMSSENVIRSTWSYMNPRTSGYSCICQKA